MKISISFYAAVDNTIEIKLNGDLILLFCTILVHNKDVNSIEGRCVSFCRFKNIFFGFLRY